MILVGIDIGKNQHTFSMVDKETGEILFNPSVFNNNQEGFLFLIQKMSSYTKSELLIGMEDTGHYHFALLTICDVIGSNQRKSLIALRKLTALTFMSRSS